MDYKETLNLPSTSFSMKANLSQNEPKILAFWAKEAIVDKIRKKYKGKKKFILHDGPPYANGNIHIGHALNKILKDIIIRFKTMQGFDSPYIPGWDCHGLPVEHQLFKELNITKEEISQLDFRKKACGFALKFVDIQREQFKRLGIFGDWENAYLTLDKKYEYEIVSALGQLVKKGFIYRGLKPVNWCLDCETALAEAEVEYEDRISPSIYVKFKITTSGRTGKNSSVLSSECCLAVWTTTPWTLYGNVAVAVHPQAHYLIVDTERGSLVVAKNLLERFLKDMGLEKDRIKIKGAVLGKDLEGLVYEHPLLGKDGITRSVVLADYVSQEEGTGLVHIAPGHGQEDYSIGLKYNLPVLMPVDKRGRLDKTAGELSGQNVFDANRQISQKLKSLGCLLFLGEKQHSYPHCWRCKTPVISRATKQWFLNIAHRDLRKMLLSAIENDIHFIPAAGKERIKAMVELRPDWCLSRQRYWGVPIPAVRCLSCYEETLEPRVIDNFAREVGRFGSDIWFKDDVYAFLPRDFRCPHCAGDKFSRGEDILDVWFDSGVSHRGVLMNNDSLEFPASLYLEGSDQHRGWFQASLIPSLALEGLPPFRSVLTHGFVVDGQGRKMSKSIGNVISPQDIIKDYGSDVLRLWVASGSYMEDVRISLDILFRLSDAYRKIRNTIRFILGNIYDFSPAKDTVPYDKMLEIDRYSLSITYNLLKKITGYYENFEFYKIYQEIYQFCIVAMSNFYLDILKDRLYTFNKNGLARRSAQTAMHEIFLILIKGLAPILPFTSEEAWQHAPGLKNYESVHLSDWPEFKNKYIDDELENKWYNLIQFRGRVLKAIEEKRACGLIGSSLEAQIAIGLGPDNSFLEDFKGSLAEIFIVSAVVLKEASECYLEVLKAPGIKCPRCWNYSERIGENRDYLQLCPKCIFALSGEKRSE